MRKEGEETSSISENKEGWAGDSCVGQWIGLHRIGSDRISLPCHFPVFDTVCESQVQQSGYHSVLRREKNTICNQCSAINAVQYVRRSKSKQSLRRACSSDWTGVRCSQMHNGLRQWMNIMTKSRS